MLVLNVADIVAAPSDQQKRGSGAYTASNVRSSSPPSSSEDPSMAVDMSMVAAPSGRRRWLETPPAGLTIKAAKQAPTACSELSMQQRSCELGSNSAIGRGAAAHAGLSKRDHRQRPERHEKARQLQISGAGRWRRTRFSVPLRRSQSPGDARSYIRPLRGKSRGFQADGLDERSRSFDDRR